MQTTNKKFLIIILIFLNILLWLYYFIYKTDIYNVWFVDFEQNLQVSEQKDNGTMIVTFYDKLEENLIIMTTPTGKIVLINTGIDKHSRKIEKYIADEKLFFIDKIFFTNNKQESINGLQNILNTISVGEIIDGSTSYEANSQYRFLRYFLRHHPEIGYVRPKQGQTVYVDPYLDVKTFFAVDVNGEKFGDMFLLVTYDNIDILFTTGNLKSQQAGFLHYFETQDLKNKFYIENIDVLEYPNMNYHDNILKAFIKKIKPRYLVVGANSIYKNDFIDMNAWNIFNKNKFYVKYIGKDKTLKLVTNGKNIKFSR